MRRRAVLPSIFHPCAHVPAKANCTSDAQGIFVFFNSGRSQQSVASALAAQGIDIGRNYPPLDTWVRISIGLPEENAIARRAVADLLRTM